jgi:hypothetical protein
VTGLSCRLFLVDENDVLYRLLNAKFDQMLRRPAEHRLPRFAGARVRMASVIVGLEDRKPIRVVRTNYSILSFDKTERFDLTAYEQPLRARMDLAFGALRNETAGSMKVIEAADRFVDRGGRWEPSRAVARRWEKTSWRMCVCFCLRCQCGAFRGVCYCRWSYVGADQYAESLEWVFGCLCFC